jgi:hypothetical protein
VPERPSVKSELTKAAISLISKKLGQKQRAFLRLPKKTGYWIFNIKTGTAYANDQCYSGVDASEIISLLSLFWQSLSRLRSSPGGTRNHL